MRNVSSVFKVTDGFEPTIRELQSHALPLGYDAILNYMLFP